MDITNTKFRAVIFDYGNVLFSYDPPVQELANLYDVSAEKIKELSYLAEKLGSGNITEKEYWEQLSKELGKPIPNNVGSFWKNDFRQGLPLYSDIMDFIEKLKESEFKTAVLSNTIPPHVEAMKEIGSLDKFDVVVLSPEVRVRKPDSRIYEIALERLSVKPNECIFIDDKKENVKSARELGITTVLAQNSAQIIEDVTELIIDKQQF